MKIFNWVHRKFRRNLDYGLVAQKKGLFDDEIKKVQHGKTASFGMRKNETEALLLEDDTLIDVFNGWQNGILTIGTFGLDQLKRYEEDEEYENEENDYNDAEELNPLAVKTFKEELEMVFGSNHVTTTTTGAPANKQMHHPELPAAVDNPLCRFLEWPDFHSLEKQEEMTMTMITKEKRTTLADLFSAEVPGKSNSGGLSPVKSKKPSCRKNHGLSFAKKLMGCKGEESGPRTKLHRMVIRMLKKKIHPELEIEIQSELNATKIKPELIDSVDHGPNTGAGGLAYDSDDGGYEAVSLLRGSSQRNQECWIEMNSQNTALEL